MTEERRIILLPSLPLNIIPYEVATIVVWKRRIEDIQRLININKAYTSKGITVLNYIRHAPTNQLISKYFQFTDKSNESYVFNDKDFIFVITLKQRTPISGKDVEVKEEDLLIFEIAITQGSWV
jgi:hypothetical protein